MGAGDIAHDRQSQARSSTASGDEGVEQALADIERYARPVIAHTKHECVRTVRQARYRAHKTASAAASNTASALWIYRLVTDRPLWPSNAAIVKSEYPRSAARDANECRKT